MKSSKLRRWLVDFLLRRKIIAYFYYLRFPMHH